MINKINCESPRFILNPNFLKLLSVHRYYVLNDGKIRFASTGDLTAWRLFGHTFSSYIQQLNLENVNNFGIVDKDTGELLPMFYLVPCGKCLACRYRKTLDWKTRCCCESATASSAPLFFTLTYKPDCLHDDGLSKRDIQNWLKRLRSRLAYYGHDASNLRYFIVGEYGHNTKRAHYHGLFWNFPYFDRFVDKIDIIHDTWKKGYTMVSPARDLSGAYCMKYMMKDSNCPEGKNKEFYLSSRKNGGLGAQWLKDNFDYYRSHPQCTDLQVRDLNGNVHTCVMPLYFQRKLFPTLCGLIPLDIRRTLDKFLVYYHQLGVVNEYCARVFLPVKCNFSWLDDVRESYEEFGLVASDYDLSQVFNYFSYLHKDLRNNISDIEYLKSYQSYLYGLCGMYHRQLVSFMKHHIDSIHEILEISRLHKQFVSTACEHLNRLELDDYLFKIQNYMDKSLQKEIF